MAEIVRAEVHAYRYPLARAMQTVFGPLESRPAVILRLEDSDGAVGWGEIWCNFPQPGAEYRARLAAAVIPGALKGLDATRPREAFRTIRARLHRLSLQAGEPGPADQIASGLDIALHDLAARRAGVPLATFLGGSLRALRPYASGIDSRLASEMIHAAREAGYRAFKLRIGFADANAAADVGAAAADLKDGELLMVDANQAWDRETACREVDALAEIPLQWVEEPLPVDDTADNWAAVANACAVPIAGGENMRSRPEFDAAISGTVFGVLQPDVCKWGGLSECASIARVAIAAGKLYCPHYLGGGVGLMASAHLLSAVGGDGLLEVDVNDNLLRDRLSGPLLPLDGQTAVVPDAPGLGYEPDLKSVADMKALSFDIDVR
ncbi:MAG: mandelate racemase/muconate lactonizing enzyme family protein [Pseudomonadota bacterium]